MLSCKTHMSRYTVYATNKHNTRTVHVLYTYMSVGQIESFKLLPDNIK